MNFIKNFFKKYRLFLNNNEKKFILNNSKFSTFNPKKKTIIFVFNYDYYFLLLYKNLINEKNLLKNYNIVGIWSTNVYPNKNKNSLVYKLKLVLNIIYDLIIFYKCKKIYSSIGFSKFYHYNFSYYFRKKIKVSNKEFEFQNLSELIQYKFDDIWLGDLIHDTFVKFTSNPTVDINHPILKKIIRKSISTLEFIKELDNDLNFKILISPYSSYLSFGPIVRYSSINNKEVFTCGSMFSYFKKIFPSRPLHSENSLNFKKMFENLENKNEKIELSKKEMDKKFSGKKVMSNQYIAVNTYDEKFYKYDDERLNQLDGVVFLHDYFDAAHDQENLIFNNFYEWSEYTFNLIKNEKLNIGIKTHPNSVRDSKKAEESFKKKYQELIWIDSKVSNLNIFKKRNIKFGVSVNGSVLYELPYFNKLGISCGTNPTSAFDFNLNPKNLDEYKYFLKNAHKVNFKQIDLIEVYKMYYAYCMLNKDDISLVSRDLSLLSFKSKINYDDECLIKLDKLISEKLKRLDALKND